MDIITHDPARSVANFHLLFNIAIAIVFLPLLTPYAAFITRLLPVRADPNDPSKPVYLDQSANEVPAVALGNAAREALRLADMLQRLLDTVRSGFLRDNRHRSAEAREIHMIINRLDGLITRYLATLDQENMNRDDHQRLNEILTFSSNIAHAASVATTGLLAHTATLRKQGWELNPRQREELMQTLDRLARNLRQTAALLVTEDLRSARQLAMEKDEFRAIEANASDLHLQKIKLGQTAAVDAGALYLEILRDAKTVNSYVVGAAAYPILAKHGELLPNRLRETGN